MTSGRNGMPAPADQDGEQALSLVFGSSTGSDSILDLKLWLSPLPPPGPVTMVCRWPEFDLDETAHEPPTNLLPDDGWFAGQD